MPAFSWEGLRDRFLAYSQAVNTPRGTDWRMGWRLVVSDPWYQDQLARCASKVLGQRPPQRDWQDEVQQEAIALLARQFQAAVDLHVDPVRAQRQFPVWMRTIIYRSCQEAVRGLKRLYRGSLPLGQVEPLDGRTVFLQSRYEVNWAVEQLPQPHRTILALYSKGLRLREIARHLGLDYAATCRAWRHAIDVLQWGAENQD